MSPHAVPLSDRDSSPASSDGRQGYINGLHDDTNISHHLQRADDSAVHDLVCVGFGPASLAVAVALHDALDTSSPSLRTRTPKVRFLEKQPQFAWHAGMLLPGTKMQITFVKDLATLRNPRSEFTFLNYLFRKNRLVTFTNLSTFLPQRIEYEDYMKWCASWFTHVVDYSQAVTSVSPAPKDPKTGLIPHFTVTSTNSLSNQTQILHTKHILIATGGSPSIPACIPYPHPRILHSSQFATHLPSLFPTSSSSPPNHIAIIGAGQSAAEIFSHLPTLYPSTKITLLIRGSALRPSDDSPFVNEIFNPERINHIFSQEENVRAKTLAEDRATNYSVVRLELLEEIYSRMYMQRVTQGADEEKWGWRILNWREVVGVSDDRKEGGLRLKVRNSRGKYFSHDGEREEEAEEEEEEEQMDVDCLIVASGYKRNAHEEMLQGMEGLKSSRDGKKGWEVRRDYGVKLSEGKVDKDAGVWLQGCNEKTHGLSDSLLSVLAVRGGEMVQSIFGRQK